VASGRTLKKNGMNFIAWSRYQGETEWSPDNWYFPPGTNPPEDRYKTALEDFSGVVNGNIDLYAVYPGVFTPEGDVVFYAKESYSDGWRFLAAAPADLSTDAERDFYVSFEGRYQVQYFLEHRDMFFFQRQNYSKADVSYDPGRFYFDIDTGTAIGAGKGNTDLLKPLPTNYPWGWWDRTTGSAAYYVDDPDGDWFLPSKDELEALYNFVKNAGAIPGFAPMSGAYWSSSQYEDPNGTDANDYYKAWALLFGDWDDSIWAVDYYGDVFHDGWYYDDNGSKTSPRPGVSFPHVKNALHKVRPVRRF
jgi:hypothetical protein